MIKWLRNTSHDIRELKVQYQMNPFLAVFSNRGFHALFVYRLCNWLNSIHIPLVPLVLTRIVQVLYGIDIDYKAQIKGGIIIIHGVGLVIGEGAIIESGTILYHGVTLGRKTQGKSVPKGDGFPTIGKNCVIGAGAKLLGPVRIGEGSVIGANCVVTNSLDANTLIKLAEQSYLVKTLSISNIHSD